MAEGSRRTSFLHASKGESEAIRAEGICVVNVTAYGAQSGLFGCVDLRGFRLIAGVTG